MSIRIWLIATTCLLSLLASPVSADQKFIGVDHKAASSSALDNSSLSLYVWEKRRWDITPEQFAKSGRVVLLAHGATISGRVDFDLQVPPDRNGLTYSLMDYLAGQGYDVFSVDYQNYGRSDHHDCGLCVTTQVAANDVNAAADYIRKLRGVQKIYVLGWSWGASTAALFAQQHPEKVRRLVQYAPYLQLKTPGLEVPKEEFRKVDVEKCCRDDFNLEFTDPGVYEAFAAEALKWDVKAPNGVRADVAAKMPVLDPKQITVPTLVIFGALDTSCTIAQEELPGYFRDLATLDKQLIIVPEGGHALMMMKPRSKFYLEVIKWFSLDQAGDN
jgi:pimeloyl-ACP methyl ester carboxylesterase